MEMEVGTDILNLGNFMKLETKIDLGFNRQSSSDRQDTENQGDPNQSFEYSSEDSD